MSRHEYNKSRERTPEHGAEAEVFRSYLKQKGLKFTAARHQLLEQIFAMNDHFTADQLLDRLKKNRLRVSKATVYRTLSVMLDCGLLNSHDFGVGALFYEHTHGHARHNHMYCLDTKQILEFKAPEIDEQLRSIAKEMRFDVSSISIQLFGYSKGYKKETS